MKCGKQENWTEAQPLFEKLLVNISKLIGDTSLPSLFVEISVAYVSFNNGRKAGTQARLMKCIQLSTQYFGKEYS